MSGAAWAPPLYAASKISRSLTHATPSLTRLKKNKQTKKNVTFIFTKYVNSSMLKYLNKPASQDFNPNQLACGNPFTLSVYDFIF